MVTELRNLVSGEVNIFGDREAAELLTHAWFKKFYAPVDAEFPPLLDMDRPPVSDWIEDPDHPGYLMQS